MTCIYMHVACSIQMYVQKCERERERDGWMDRWMDGWMDGWMEVLAKSVGRYIVYLQVESNSELNNP